MIRNKPQALLPKFLQDFAAFNPSESVLIKKKKKKSPAYILFLPFHHQTNLLRVFQTQTIQQSYCVHPLRHWQRGQKEAKLETTVPAPASLWMLLGLLNICFWLHGEGRGEEGEIKICPVFRAQTEFQKERLKKPFLVSAESTQPAYLTFLYSSYFMPDLRFQIPRGEVCLEHYL